MSSTPYERQFSFALFSAESPADQQPGNELDTEFNAVKVSLDDTQQNLAKIQDDDGALKRGSVGKAQFDSSVSIGFAAPSQWASGVLYTAQVNTVFQNSKFYIANTTHTSGVSFDVTKWDQIADFTLAAVIPDGSITTAKIANNAINTALIADGTVTNSKIATGAVDNTKLANASVDINKFVAGIGPSIANIVIPAGLGPLPWPMATLPVGWDWADGGVLLSNTAFPALRAALIADGFPHGQDGSGNPFKPDARGRVIASADALGGGAGASRLSSATITGGALNGKSGGQEVVTLTTNQISNHTHANSLNEGGGHVHNIPMPLQGNGGGAPTSNARQGDSGSGATVANFNSTAAVTGIGLTNASQGGGSSHTNVMPTLVCNMIVKAH